MKFSKTRPVKIVMLGAGGTGGHIAPHLYRLLYSLDRPVRFIICDGDVVEEKNLVRQNFTPADLGENKAQVLAEWYSAVFGMETEYVPSFVEGEEQLRGLLEPEHLWMRQPGHSYSVRVPEQVILIGAVDNNKSRHLCHRVFCQARVSADSIRTDNLEAVNVACARLIAKRVETSELFASESAAVSCLLSADYVKAGRLSVGLSDIDEVRADEIINLKQKKRSLFRFLLASSLRSWWMRFTAPAEDAVDAEYEVKEPAPVVHLDAEKENKPAA